MAESKAQEPGWHSECLCHWGSALAEVANVLRRRPTIALWREEDVVREGTEVFVSFRDDTSHRRSELRTAFGLTYVEHAVRFRGKNRLDLCEWLRSWPAFPPRVRGRIAPGLGPVVLIPGMVPGVQV